MHGIAVPIDNDTRTYDDQAGITNTVKVESIKNIEKDEFHSGVSGQYSSVTTIQFYGYIQSSNI